MWPRTLRATGLGEIQGGEIVLVPAARIDLFLRSARDLAQAGIAGAVLPSTVSASDVRLVADAGIALALVDDSTDMKTLQLEIERYVIRRRRELFDLGQHVHRLLVDAAIAGATIQEIISKAAETLGRTVALDRDGDIIGPCDLLDSTLPFEAVRRIRVDMARNPVERIYVDLEDGLAATPVLTGDDRRGTVILAGVLTATLDEDELALSTVAAAAAIALSRESVSVYPLLDDLVSSADQGPAPGAHNGPTQWTALAMLAPGVDPNRTARALNAELAARNVPFQIGREDVIAAALIAGPGLAQAEEVRASVAARLGVPSTRAGLSRIHVAGGGPIRATREALAALEHAGEGEMTRFEAIELDEILASVPDWQYFVAARLGPLLDGTTGSDALLRTLSVYLGTGRNAVEAAGRLHVHRNTLRYRLQAIRRLLNVDLDRPDDAFVLDLTLRLLAAHGDKLSRICGSD
jgi:hypothetical protein